MKKIFIHENPIKVFHNIKKMSFTDIRNIYNMQDFYDIKIQINEKKYKFHKCVISQSDFLRNLISHKWKSSQRISGEHSRDWKSSALSLSLPFSAPDDYIFNSIKTLYSIYPELTVYNVYDYIKISSYLDLNSLMYLCSTFLLNYVNDINVLDLLLFSLQYDTSFILYTKCLSHLLQRIWCIRESLKDKDIKDLKDLLIKILKSEALWLPSANSRYELAQYLNLDIEIENFGSTYLYLNYSLSDSMKTFCLPGNCVLNIYHNVNVTYNEKYIIFSFVYFNPTQSIRLLLPGFNKTTNQCYTEIMSSATSSISNENYVQEFALGMTDAYCNSNILSDKLGEYIPIILVIYP